MKQLRIKLQKLKTELAEIKTSLHAVQRKHDKIAALYQTKLKEYTSIDRELAEKTVLTICKPHKKATRTNWSDIDQEAKTHKRKDKPLTTQLRALLSNLPKEKVQEIINNYQKA